MLDVAFRSRKRVSVPYVKIGYIEQVLDGDIELDGPSDLLSDKASFSHLSLPMSDLLTIVCIDE